MANVVQPNVNTAAGPTSTWQYKKNGAGGRFGAPPPPVVPERSREDMHSTEALEVTGKCRRWEMKGDDTIITIRNMDFGPQKIVENFKIYS